MNRLYFFLLIGVIVTVSLTNVEYASASSIEISTDKQTYAYGDYLSFTIEVSEIISGDAVLHIRDENSTTSSPINLPISKLKTTITAPKPFDPLVYKTGKYFLEIEYNGAIDETEFILIKSDKIVIPSWIKDLGGYWVQNQIDDKTFSQGIQYLIKQKIIQVPTSLDKQSEHAVKIPEWIKTSTVWWIEGKISDNDYGMAIQHLIKVGIIVL